MYIYITRYCSNSVIISLQRIRQREKFSSSQERTSQRHTEEQDLGGTEWEKKGAKQKSKKEKKGWGWGGTYTDTGISYINKQKDDLGCCSMQTEHAQFFTASKGSKQAGDTESMSVMSMCDCVCVCLSVSVCISVWSTGCVCVCATCLFYFTKSPLVFGIWAVENKPR